MIIEKYAAACVTYEFQKIMNMNIIVFHNIEVETLIAIVGGQKLIKIGLEIIFGRNATLLTTE